MSVAAPAGERQIIKVCCAAVLLCYYVIHFVWEEGDLGREQTVFAAVPRTLDLLAA